MEKQFKPIPDAECLKYHGTPEKPDIKIFVSHRIDKDSEVIDNPLYIPVRCGAVYDDREGVTMLGDDTGDNISEKRMSFCEYTVMYWAWKNIEADYYGLCHYRRYLSFSTEIFEEWNEQRFYFEQELNSHSAARHRLLDPNFMKSDIKKYDVTTSVRYECSKVPLIPSKDNVKELFVEHPSLLTSQETLDRALRITKEKFPQYYGTLCEELKSKYHLGFNCFIMRKDLFNLMCEYIFGILFELDELFEKGLLFQSNPREPGYVGEILYGSFIRWVMKQEKYKVNERHITLFWNTERKSTVSANNAYGSFKNFLKRILPAYRCSLRVEEKIQQQQMMIAQQRAEIAELKSLIGAVSADVRKLSQRELKTFWTQPHDFQYATDEQKLKFWRDYPKATGDLRIVQEGNTVLLKRFKKICDLLGISFWLHGGTLIGALRHSGFVPWDDDDDDVAMLRKDFDKVQAYLEDNETYEITNYYYIGIGARSYRFRRTDMDANCFVDIFVYDYYDVKNDDELMDWKNQTQKKAHLIKALKELCKELNSYPAEPTLEGFSELREGLDEIFERYIHNMQGTEKSKYLIWGMDNNYEDSSAYAWKHGRIFAIDDIFPLLECEYEGEKFLIPNNFEKYAMAEYGIRYVEMPSNMGESIHFTQYFSGANEIENIKKLIEAEGENL